MIIFHTTLFLLVFFLSNNWGLLLHKVIVMIPIWFSLPIPKLKNVTEAIVIDILKLQTLFHTKGQFIIYTWG
jgi:hypothetical protein